MTDFDEFEYTDDQKYRLDILRQLIELEDELGIRSYDRRLFEGLEEDPED